MTQTLLKFENVSFSYQNENIFTPVLKNISLQIEEGRFVAITGPSGSGKSTFLYLASGFMQPDNGQVFWKQQNLAALSESTQAFFRNQEMGFIFQQFHLLPGMSILENITLPFAYHNNLQIANFNVKQRAFELAELLDIKKLLFKLPNQLSGGEQQRVAIARALLLKPKIIFADEPTGNLDSNNALNLLEILKKIKGQGHSIVMITHDNELAKQSDEIFYIKDGKLIKHQINSPDNNNIAKSQITLNPSTSSYPSPQKSRTQFLQPWRWAMQNIKRNRIRSFLTSLGVVVGMAAVVSMLSVGSYVKEKILAGYEVMGVNKVQFWGHPNWRLTATDQVKKPFEFFDYEKDLLPLLRIFREIKYLSPLIRGWKNVSSGGIEVKDISVYGVNSSYFLINNKKLSEGLYFTPFQIERAASVCVIGSELSKQLFPKVPPVNQFIFIANSEGGPTKSGFFCQVIGVLQPEKDNKDSYSPPGQELFVPYTAASKFFNIWNSQIRGMHLQTFEGNQVEPLSQKIEAFFKNKYGKAGQFKTAKNDTMISQMKQFLNLFELLLAIIAGVTLFVGSMGITNMMFVTVNERMKEIGLRRMLGAKSFDILKQFLIESVFLCSLGGVWGIGLGVALYFAAIKAISQFYTKLSFSWEIPTSVLFLAFGILGAVGVFAGLVPAFKASKLSPVQALRSD